MSRTYKSKTSGGVANPKSITQFSKGRTVVIKTKYGKDKPIRSEASDRNHIWKKYGNRKRRYGFRKQAEIEENEDLYNTDIQISPPY